MQRGFIAILTMGILALSALSAASEHVALHKLDAPKVIYVDDDAPGGNDGSNWTNAFNNLQDALMFASTEDEIRVGRGVYRPDEFVLSDRANLGRMETFQLINGVTIKGGYAGFGEPNPNTRDIELYETILSGDLLGNDDPCTLR